MGERFQLTQHNAHLWGLDYEPGWVVYAGGGNALYPKEPVVKVDFDVEREKLILTVQKPSDDLLALLKIGKRYKVEVFLTPED